MGRFKSMACVFLGFLWSSAAQAGLVVVLKSDDLEAYDTTVKAFTEVMGRDVTVWSIQGRRDKAEEIIARLRRNPPSLIFALGPKAAWTATHEFPDTPVIYGLIRDPKRYGLKGDNVTGIGMDLPSETVLSQFRLYAPDVKTVGVIIGEKNPMGEDLVRAARATGLDLQIRRVQGARYVRSVYGKMVRRIDALWIINDSEVVTPENFRYMREESRRMGIPVMASSEVLVSAGALLAVVPDLEATGRQAADLARTILDTGTEAGSIPPTPPDGMRVLLNRDTMESLGLELDPMLLDFTDEIVGAPPTR